ncbi:hypothetical protein ACQ4PT_017699 [Festuca glaucescens]
MSTPFLERDPCPDRILDDLGGAFTMGAVGGSIFHFIKGTYHSPNGARLAGGAQAVRMNAPRIGGGFAVWGDLFSVYNCTAVFLRQKEDPWNSVIAGAATHGTLNLRRGLRAAARSAVFGGCVLALFEGFGIVAHHVFDDESARAQRNLLPPVDDGDPNLAIAAGGSGGDFRRLHQPPFSPAEVAELILGEKVEDATKQN